MRTTNLYERPKVAIYCRLSDEDHNKKNPEEDSRSIQTQKAMLRDYAHEQGWEIYDIYSDDDYSGADSSRPEYNRLLEDAEKRKFDIVLCKHQSRFTRDMVHVETYINEKFSEWGIRYVSLLDGADTSLAGNKKSRQINGLVNEWYLEDLSENMRKAYAIRKKEGKYIASCPVYGYKKDPNDPYHLIIDEPSAKIVKRIFDMCIEGMSLNVIARTLNEEGVPSPTKYKTEVQHTSSKTNSDLKKAEKILNEDHYGLEKVKERILEYLAVVHLSKAIKGPIICLVGPPGVGKTSIAKSIARATGREFVRMSLGGVRDEAEIRGHRRTYIGAIPGRIITSIKDAGTNNPVFLFDEVDKIGADFKGDPASALLEVLDPEQNKDFTDHFLDLPFDLSKVMFITTANTTETIPRPLLDRMEIIEVSGYTEEEKVKIAQQYLIPKQIKAHGLKPKNFSITEKALRDLINYYTRESGVRNLEREIGSLCRKVARRIVTKRGVAFRITPASLEKYLGKKKYRYDVVEGESEVGVVTGMAWTQVGGDTLFIETALVPGSGKIQLTGQLGDVMQESAKAAITYIRSIADQYGIEKEFYKNYDLHVHVPEGAVPKDGPSAGVTMFTAVMSALTDTPVRKDVAMTGEITLRGKVLPVGGIKEKVLAAHRAGIKTILLPRENEADIDDIPQAVRKQLDFVLLDKAAEALKYAFAPKTKKNV